jgi:methyl-accepting chemotaxis protein
MLLLPGVALMASISIIVAALDDSKLQIDVHMYYFAAITILVGYCDWRVIAASTSFVAVHHLSLNFLLPEAVYPGGADFSRFLLHAVVLVIESAVLGRIAYNLECMFTTLSQEAARASAALTAAQASHQDVITATALAEKERAQNEQARAALAEEGRRMVTDLGQGLHQMAQRDLTFRLTQPFTAEFSKIQQDFNAMAGALETAIHSVVSKAKVIRAATLEVNASAEDIAKCAEQQVSGLQDTVAALNVVTQAMDRTAQGADETRTMVAAAKSGAEQSGQVVQGAITVMSEIEGSARKIGQIIGIIDEIAFQTNLLALNAGVEAARAGESGRGFAVVASEVRALAQRSADAARDIKQLISASTAQVQRGVQLVGETGHSLAEIMGQVDKISRAVSDLAATVRTQSSGLQDVNQTIGQVRQVTQQNAALVDQSTAASRTMALEADELAQLATQFQICTASAA